jgi:hypothetical protein
MTTRLHNYAEVRAYLEKEHLDWLRALTPRRINAPAEYWPQKVLAVSSVNATMQNYVSIREHRTRPNPALAAVHGQAALLLPHEVPTYYVSRELLAAALRTELPDDMTFEAVPFPFDALVFMLPKGSVRHPTEGDCPFLVLSQTSKGQTLSLPIQGLDFSVTAEQDAVLVTTYMPEAEFNVTYYKSVPLLPGATIKQAFQQASSVPFSLIVNDELADNGEGVDLSAEDFVDKLWLLSITLLLIMVSGENLVERGRLEKLRKPKAGVGKPTEFWSPNFLGRFYKSAAAGEREGHSTSTQRLHWRRGHIKSQPHGPRHSLRKVIWVRPYRAGRE